MPKRKQEVSSDFEEDSDDSHAPYSGRRSSTAGSRQTRRLRRSSGGDEQDADTPESSGAWSITIDLCDNLVNYEWQKRLYYRFESLRTDALFVLAEDIKEEIQSFADAKGFKKISKGVKEQIKNVELKSWTWSMPDFRQIRPRMKRWKS
ncbi:uncharacterized protein JCM15063_002101 [Sporobolomyces koalae]|uniref:uncharacterized protein n=1 Tax=Sporobolomyces koalae TaxID=500713 RepID=UPI00317511BD